VLAAGVHVNSLLEPLGLSIPLRLPVVTVVRSAPLPPIIAQVLGTAGANLALRQEVGGALRFTGGAEEHAGVLDESGKRPLVRPHAGRVADVVDRARQVVPAVAEAPLDTVWGGVLDLTPDALPVIDTAPGIENLVVAAGFSGHGFGIGPVTGPLAADLALLRPPRHDLSAFAFTRFNDTAAAAPATLHG
jgi:sarcosine oxidase subunit beta